MRALIVSSALAAIAALALPAPSMSRWALTYDGQPLEALSTDATRYYEVMIRQLTENPDGIKVCVEAAGNGAGA